MVGPDLVPVLDLTAHDGSVDDLETLQRWEDFGATWEVVHRTPGQVTISLRRCDGGEEVGRLVSDDPELLAFLDAQGGTAGPVVPSA